MKKEKKMKKENVRLVGYDSSLEFEKTLKAEDFCEIANRQVIPLFNALEIELTEKDIKAAVTSRQTAKELYMAVIGNTTPKKDKGTLRKLMVTTGASEFDEQVVKCGNQTAPYNYDCFYNAETGLMEVNTEKIHDAAAVVLEGDTLSAYERVEAMANAINAVCGDIADGAELQLIMRTLEFNEDGKLAPTLNIYKYEEIVAICRDKGLL